MDEFYFSKSIGATSEEVWREVQKRGRKEVAKR